MNRRLVASESGWTLIELLVAMTLMVVVLSATLTSFDGFTSRSATAQTQSDIVENARSSIEILARQLRNLASAKPQAGIPSSFYALDYWTKYDIVFKSADPNRRRVRYCLDSSGTLWQQLEAVPGAGAPDPSLTTAMVATCPVAPSATGWNTKVTVASSVVNRRGGQDRPLFTYDQPAPAGLSVPPTSNSDFDTWESAGVKIQLIRSNLWIDANAANKAPAESNISTAVYLRNQNQKPSASFTGQAGGNHQVTLNGSGSTDPEGRTLQYAWYLGASYPGCPAGNGGAGYTLMGIGVILTYAFPDSSDQKVTLEVTDPGGLCDSLTKTVHPDAPTP